MPRTGDILGYARVSTADQDLSGQKDRLLQHGAIRVFEDVISGKTFNRPGLAALLDQARPNDTLAVIRLDRLGRSLKELLETVDGLKAREINLISLEERIDTTSAAGELVFHVFPMNGKRDLSRSNSLLRKAPVLTAFPIMSCRSISSITAR